MRREWVSALVAGLFLAACGDSSTTGGGGNGGSTSSNNNGGGGEGTGGRPVINGGNTSVGGGGGTQGVCGDGTADIGEDCDGTDLTGETCRAQGFDGGRLTCNADCTFNTTACTSRACGDGIINGNEDCDGTQLGGTACTDLGFDAGRLACANDCSFDTSACTTFTCGDGAINGNEDCDGALLGGSTCTSIGQGFTGGTLACTNNCVFDVSGCGAESCVDGVDNDFDTLADCSDSDCTAACADACNTVPTLTDPSTVDGDTTGHADVYDGSCEVGTGGELVYTFTPANTGVVDIVLSSATDQGISVWTACGTGELRCADDFGGGTDETITVAATAGTPIFIQVEAFFTGEEGPFTLDVSSRAIICGDGIVDSGEACDDGNTTSGDGCSATCALECGDGTCGGNEDSCSCPADCPDDPNSCSVCQCGNSGGNCFCDDLCLELGDCCGNVSASCSGLTETFTFNSNNPNPVTVTDDAYNGTLGTMACVSLPTPALGFVTSINSVQVTATHTFIGDLVFKLISPSGTVVTLMSRPGFVEPADDGTSGFGSGDDLVATAPITFQTGAAVGAETMGAAAGTIICQTAAPGDGICTYAPNNGAALAGDLTTFAGQAPTGTWQFCAGDAAAGDVGTINTVAINMTVHD